MVQSHIAIADSNPNILMASVATKDGVKLYRSEDAGANWAVITRTRAPQAGSAAVIFQFPALIPKIQTWSCHQHGHVEIN